MQIDAAQGGDVQQFRRQDAAISHHHHQVGGQFPEDGFRLAVPQGGGLPHRDVVLLRQPLHRRCGHDLFAAHRLVRPGEHTHDLMPCRDQRGQAFGGDVRGAHEQDTHYSSSSSSG